MIYLLALLTLAGADSAPTDVFIAGKDGYHTFRIPALLATRQGTLLAFCEGRKTSSSDHGDVDLVLKRSEDGGKTWGALQLVYEEGGDRKITIGNPCPVLDETTGIIWLPFTRDNKDVLVTHSTDDGKTWAKPTKITDKVKRPGWSWYATGPGIGIQLRHGKHKRRLVIPCDHKIKDAAGKMISSSHVFFSDDHGKTWQLGGSASPYTNECQVAELPDGTLLLNCRNHYGREAGQKDRATRRILVRSRDAGQTWMDTTFDEALLEPVCQASLLRVGDRSLLFANPASSKREKLTVRLSDDAGKTWPHSRVLHLGPAAYSSLAILDEQTAACLFEAGERGAYERILFVPFSLKGVREGK